MVIPAWQQITAAGLFLGFAAAIASGRFDKTKAALVGGVLSLLLGILPQYAAFGGSGRRLTEVETFARQYERDFQAGSLGREGAFLRSPRFTVRENTGEVALPAPEQVQEAADTLDQAGYRNLPGADWEAIFLLVGMMILAGILGRTGVFRWIGIPCARRAQGSPFRLLVVLLLVAGVSAALLGSAATILFLVPVSLSLCRTLGLRPVPYLVGEAVAANIGAIASLVGSPANILIGSQAGYGFLTFLRHQGPLVLALLAGLILWSWLVWRRELVAESEGAADLAALADAPADQDRSLLTASLAIGAFVFVGLLFHASLGWGPATVVLGGVVALLVIARLRVEEIVEAVDWRTVFLLLGLFFMVGGLARVGLVGLLGDKIVEVLGDHPTGRTWWLLAFSAVASGLVDNSLVVTTMCPLVSHVTEGLTGLPVQEAARQPQVMALWWALSLGIGLGANGSLLGASASLTLVHAAKAEGVEIHAAEFARRGVPVVVWTLALAMLLLWFRYLRGV